MIFFQSINSNYSALNTKKLGTDLYDGSDGFADIVSTDKRFYLRIYKVEKKIEFYYKDATHTGEGWDYHWVGALS
jgi:hypothetical protein